ncbi:MAG TPA: tetratricopeptide repeat protein [Bryobacteraceae bacterium]|jgi:Flp pilus assembly protein TadD
MGRRGFALLITSLAVYGSAPEFERAHELYQRTEYRESLKLLQSVKNKDAETLQLMGQNDFMLGDYKKATDDLDKALALGNPRPELYLWLGRAYGRRAETSNPLSAPGHATHSRKMLEKAVEMDPSNKEAVGDLMDYYLDAPGFLGGGLDKAEELVKRTTRTDPAENSYLQALVLEKRKEYDAAEQHLRRATELAPKQWGHVMELARFLGRRGKTKESDALFEQAAKLAPGNPRILYYRAETYIEEKRNLPEARTLLEKYLKAPLTPDDPTREEAQQLLAKAK